MALSQRLNGNFMFNTRLIGALRLSITWVEIPAIFRS